MRAEKLKQKFDDFNFYSFQLLTPSRNRKGYLGVAAVFTVDAVIEVVKGHVPRLALPIIAASLAARLGYNAYNWAAQLRQSQPVWSRRRDRPWERFDRQLQLSGEALGGLMVGTVTVALALQGSNLVPGVLAATARQIFVCRSIVKEMGGVRKLATYRSSAPSPRNTGGPFL